MTSPVEGNLPRSRIGGRRDRPIAFGRERSTNPACSIFTSLGGVYAADDDGLPNSVGQAIFPTPAGEETADRVIEALNEYCLEPSNYPTGYAYTKGNLQTGTNPLFSHKFGGDLGIPAWLIEATRCETSLQDRIKWLTAAVMGCLSLHGISY